MLLAIVAGALAPAYGQSTLPNIRPTTFNILKSVDWAASKNARIINMSFAGPPDDLLREMLTKANARGIVLIAAVGNAGPRSPPLYPAADAGVIGVTATDVDDKLMPQANRGPQVAVAAPGVEILAVAPDGKYQVIRALPSQPLMPAGSRPSCWHRNRTSRLPRYAPASPVPQPEFRASAMRSELGSSTRWP